MHDFGVLFPIRRSKDCDNREKLWSFDYYNEYDDAEDTKDTELLEDFAGSDANVVRRTCSATSVNSILY